MKSWAADDPVGWIDDAALGPPDLTQSPRITCTDWRALRAGDDAIARGADASARLVSACFETPLATWSAEIEPLAIDRITSMALSTALRVRDDASLAPREPAHHEGDVAVQPLAGASAVGRVSLGFVRRDDAPIARACMRVCVGEAPSERASSEQGAGSKPGGLGGSESSPQNVNRERSGGPDLSCARAVREARPAGEYVAPPAATLWLRATLAAVHHPRGTALGALGLACLLGCAAILTRRRPRRSPRRAAMTRTATRK